MMSLYLALSPMAAGEVCDAATAPIRRRTRVKPASQC